MKTKTRRVQHVQHTIGVDPGAKGAVVLLLGDRVVFAMAWTERRRVTGTVYEVEAVNARGGDYSSLFAVGDHARTRARDEAPEGYLLAVEDLFGKGPTLATLAWNAGLVSGPLTANATSTTRPHPMQWRPSILGIPGNSARATEVAQKLVPLRFTGLGNLVANEHALEATCIAKYSQVMSMSSSVSSLSLEHAK